MLEMREYDKKHNKNYNIYLFTHLRFTSSSLAIDSLVCPIKMDVCAIFRSSVKNIYSIYLAGFLDRVSHRRNSEVSIVHIYNRIYVSTFDFIVSTGRTVNTVIPSQNTLPYTTTVMSEGISTMALAFTPLSVVVFFSRFYYHSSVRYLHFHFGR